MRRGGVKRRGEPVEQIARAGDRPCVEQRQQELRIVRLERGKVGELAHLVPDDDAEIPERIQEVAKEPLVLRRDRMAEEDQQVDVRVEAEVPAAVPAERQHHNRIGGRTGIGVELAQERVDAVRIPLQRGASPRASRYVRTQLRTRRVEGGAGGISSRVVAARG